MQGKIHTSDFKFLKWKWEKTCMRKRKERNKKRNCKRN